jgi:hypothetical protein
MSVAGFPKVLYNLGREIEEAVVFQSFRSSTRNWIQIKRPGLARKPSSGRIRNWAIRLRTPSSTSTSSCNAKQNIMSSKCTSVVCWPSWCAIANNAAISFENSKFTFPSSCLRSHAFVRSITNMPNSIGTPPLSRLLSEMPSTTCRASTPVVISRWLTSGGIRPPFL